MPEMLHLVDISVGSATLEALPGRRRERHTTRSSAGRPSGNEELDPGRREFSGSAPPRLPQVLVGVRVLVVDDDEDTAELFAAALTVCGANVVTANSASEALRIVTAHAPDVVVTDIAMPGGDGYWLVREIRQHVATSALPVLAVTAFGQEHSRGQAVAAGFVDYLQKPVDPEALCRAVARARQP